jgi:2,4-dichlorophenol 6-monooxygenase
MSRLLITVVCKILWRCSINYEVASPERICDLPQNLLEPLLVGAVARHGARVRFITEFIRCEQDADGVTSWVRERDSGREYAIRSKYVIGADGANSRVEQAGLPLEGRMGVSGSINIVFEADLSRFVAHRSSVRLQRRRTGHRGRSDGSAVA